MSLRDTLKELQQKAAWKADVQEKSMQRESRKEEALDAKITTFLANVVEPAFADARQALSESGYTTEIEEPAYGALRLNVQPPEGIGRGSLTIQVVSVSEIHLQRRVVVFKVDSLPPLRARFESVTTAVIEAEISRLVRSLIEAM
ncbi:hypothetical protein [Hydrocarboniphaga effusa]|uniref:hypothetical protein n=1 Tax=Hydrocarboniphaga effusa TaxID=243629 RepID=UPI003BADBD21